jgi:hypothetical protein
VRAVLQSKSFYFTVIALLGGVLVVAGVWGKLTGPPTNNLADSAISDTGWLASAGWCTAMLLVLVTPLKRPMLSNALIAWLARGIYTWACAIYFLHLVLAFHLGHAWSHGHAVEHVEERSGFGPGIFVSHAFSLLWLADVIWSWAAFGSYRRRGGWWNGPIYGFMAFVVFNATVVYGEGSFRGCFALVFLLVIVTSCFPGKNIKVRP